MIPNKEKEGLHYLAVKRLSSLLLGITSKHKGDFYCLNYFHSEHQGSFYCLNCIHSFEAENKFKFRKNKDLCGIVMPSEKYNISEFDQFMKTNKMLYITYADIESLKEKIDG